MAFVTCNGKPVLSLRLSLPRFGAWVADVELASEAGAAGFAVIEDGVLRWTGTVLRAGSFSGRTHARIVAAIGLRKILPAKHYLGLNLKLVASDVLVAVGERLASSSQKDTLSRTLDYWTRTKGSAGGALGSLLGRVSAGWRTEADGAVWIGVDSFPVQKFEHHELARNDALGTALISSESLELRPGVTFDGRPVSRVEHVIENGALRTSYWVESTP